MNLAVIRGQFDPRQASPCRRLAPPPGGGGGNAGLCNSDGDPVACQTGLFHESQTDLSLADTLSLSVERNYRQNDPNLRSFGIGANHDLNYYLYLVPFGTDHVYFR